MATAEPFGCPRRVRRALVILLLAYGGWIRFSLPAVPFADPDSWGYVGPTVKAALEGEFTQVNGRDFIYPLLVRAALSATASFQMLVRVQHLFGLVGAGLFALAWAKTRRLLPASPTMVWIHDAIGLLALACYVLNNELIFYEHSLRPEAIFSAVACATLWCVVTAGTADSKSAAFVRSALGLAALHAILFMLHPSFGWAAGAGLVPVWLRAIRGHLPARKVGLILVALPAAFLGLRAADHLIFARPDLQGGIFGPMELFSFNADVVEVQMQRELAPGGRPAYPPDVLRGCLERFAANRELTQRLGRPDPSLDYYPDNLLYDKNSVCHYLFGIFHDDPARLNRFFLHYFAEGVLHSPGLYLAKIGRSLAVAYGPQVSLVSYLCADHIDITHQLEYSEETLFGARPQMNVYGPGVAYREILRRTPRRPQAVDAHWAQSLLARGQVLYRPALLLSGLIFLFGLWGRRSLARPLLLSATLAVTLFAYNFFICLTVAMINVLDNVRYSQNQAAFTIFALANGVMLIAHFVYCVARSASTVVRRA
jgi:hypothetical protein